jgi:hypothetical protein
MWGSAILASKVPASTVQGTGVVWPRKRDGHRRGCEDGKKCQLRQCQPVRGQLVRGQPRR